jgi:hypothetical protein
LKIKSRIGIFRRTPHLLGVVTLLSLMFTLASQQAGADPLPIGTMVSTVDFSEQCGSGIGVGLTFDGTNLWYSCYASSPDLYRADVHTGQVTGSWDISHGLGALAYDVAGNKIIAGWGTETTIGQIVVIQLNSSMNVTGSAFDFSTCPHQCSESIDDGLSVIAGSGGVLVSEDGSTTISEFARIGNQDGNYVATIPWAGNSCYNSGVAIGDSILFEGADGCNTIYAVDTTYADANDPGRVLYSFSTAVPGDPNFRDEGLTCDQYTFASQGYQVIWSKEAYPPMRAHAFLIPGGTCAAAGGPPAPYSGPTPLILAHGITGSAAGESTMQSVVDRTIPGLASGGRVVKVATPSDGSVWENGPDIAQAALNLRTQLGSPTVNVLAHSKGGLDTRYAIFLTQGLSTLSGQQVISELGMLSTPNAGSKLADYLCGLRRLGSDSLSQFGPCDNASNGLYDLQDWYVKDVFNRIVRDSPDVNYYDLGSNCAVTPGPCTGAVNFEGCRDGGDEAVCLESAYWLTKNYIAVPGGSQDAIPNLVGYTHSQMNTDDCPIQDMLAQLYPPDEQPNNPWTTGTPACADIGTRHSSAANNTYTDQSLIDGEASPSQPFTMVMDPEGADTMRATVFIPSGITPSITVTDASGNPDPSATVQIVADDGFGTQAAIVSLSGLGGTPRTLSVGVDSSAAIGVATEVASTVTLRTSAAPSTASAGNDALATAMLNCDASTAQQTTVTATYTDASGVKTSTNLPYQSTSGGSSTFSAPINVPLGAATSIDVTAAGSQLHRYATTGIYLPDGSGTLGHVHDDALVDTNNDGKVDSLDLPVQVTVSSAGAYHLSVDVASHGQTIASGNGDANLQPGTNDIHVTIPVTRLLASNAASGTFELVNGTLTEGTTDRTLIDQASDLGSTATYDLDAFAPVNPYIAPLAVQSLDTNNDGRLDTLRVSSDASVPTAGTYRLTGTLYGANGSSLTAVNQTYQLSAGRNSISTDIDGHVIGGTRASGTYQLRGFLLTAFDGTPSNTDETAFLTINAANWIGYDVTPPVITTAPQTIMENTTNGYVGPIPGTTVTDPDDPTSTLTITNNAPSPIPPGTTTVTWTAQDPAGNTSTATQAITITTPRPITLVGTAHGGNSSIANPVTVTLPTGTAAGDQILVGVALPTGQSVTTPAGYTVVGTYTSGSGTGDAKEIVYRRTAAADDRSLQLTFSGGLYAYSFVVGVYRGVDPTNPVDGMSHGTTSGGLTVTAPAVTTNFPGDRLVLLNGKHNSNLFANGWVPPAGMTQETSDAVPTSACELADATQTDSGSTGSKTSTAQGTANSGLVSVLLALRGAPTA